MNKYFIKKKKKKKKKTFEFHSKQEISWQDDWLSIF